MNGPRRGFKDFVTRLLLPRTEDARAGSPQQMPGARGPVREQGRDPTADPGVTPGGDRRRMIVQLSAGAATYQRALQTELGDTFAVVAQAGGTPDVLILASSDPGIEATIHEWRLATTIVIVNQTGGHEEPGRVARLIDAGASNYLLTPAPSALAAHIRAILRWRLNAPPQ